MPLGIIWEGPQSGLHSFAQVNRAFCLGLIERGHDLALIPTKSIDGGERIFSKQPLLDERFHRRPHRPVTAHVHHTWPPSFVPPAEGHWVIMQPWEFGSLPRSWIGPLCNEVDEVWAYTRYVRDCYIASGVPGERVHVVPLGVDTRLFSPSAAPRPLQTRKPFKFLFVGGTIHRKGIDVLLAAYADAFTAGDPVCLVIKDMGGSSFYRGQTAAEQVRQIQSQADTPEIEYIKDELGADELAGLYTACNCLVQPYRGEGFGLPIAEAMASGLPAIVTGHGAALDYCSEENAYLIPARVVRLREKRIGDLETVDSPWLAEPDRCALRDLLRTVADRPEEARSKGRLAAEYVRAPSDVGPCDRHSGSAPGAAHAATYPPPEKRPGAGVGDIGHRARRACAGTSLRRRFGLPNRPALDSPASLVVYDRQERGGAPERLPGFGRRTGGRDRSRRHWINRRHSGRRREVRCQGIPV